MSQNTKIEWCDYTFNPWIGCTKVGPGCDHCYAENINSRFKGGNWGAGAPRRRTSEANWKLPLKWNREAEKRGIRYRVFCASMGDWLDNEVRIDWLVDLLDLIRQTPNLNWLLLTKRIANIGARLHMAIEFIEHLPGFSDETERHEADSLRDWLANWVLLGDEPENIWIGATVVNQKEADRDIPKLISIPAKVRFLSVEPMLGHIDLVQTGALGCDCGDNDSCFGECRFSINAFDKSKRIDWVICGGESGPGARPMNPVWAESLRDQCQRAGVPFFFKQWGGVNKKKAGRDLDGQTWSEFPSKRDTVHRIA